MAVEIPVKSISADQLRRAAEIKDEIEKLENELSSILGAEEKAAATTGAKRGPKKGSRTTKGKGKKGRPKGSKSPLKGRKRPVSPSGPLGPAVIKVLKRSNEPMSVGDIFEGLQEDGYQFTAGDPKKNLYARIHSLKGVERVAPGRFSIDEEALKNEENS